MSNQFSCKVINKNEWFFKALLVMAEDFSLKICDKSIMIRCYSFSMWKSSSRLSLSLNNFGVDQLVRWFSSISICWINNNKSRFNSAVTVVQVENFRDLREWNFRLFFLDLLLVSLIEILIVTNVDFSGDRGFNIPKG